MMKFGHVASTLKFFAGKKGPICLACFACSLKEHFPIISSDNADIIDGDALARVVEAYSECSEI